MRYIVLFIILFLSILSPVFSDPVRVSPGSQYEASIYNSETQEFSFAVPEQSTLTFTIQAEFFSPVLTVIAPSGDSQSFS
ncbi:MAG: hypothetical protein ACLFR1_07530, partial [Spirochaetia bacterium]